MLKTGILGRREGAPPQSNDSSLRASPESPRYAPNTPSPGLAPLAGSSASDKRAQTAEPSSDGRVKSEVGLPRLTVGPNIRLKGAQIDDCDTLVIEGHVEAAMDSKSLEILATGSFEGTVTIDVAEIHGRFTGSLTARKKLIIHATGQVSGTVRYGALLVAEGGVVIGDLAQLNVTDRPPGSSTPEARAFAGYPSTRTERQQALKEHDHV